MWHSVKLWIGLHAAPAMEMTAQQRYAARYSSRHRDLPELHEARVVGFPSPAGTSFVPVFVFVLVLVRLVFDDPAVLGPALHELLARYLGRQQLGRALEVAPAVRVGAVVNGAAVVRRARDLPVVQCLGAWNLAEDARKSW